MLLVEDHWSQSHSVIGGVLLVLLTVVCWPWRCHVEQSVGLVAVVDVGAPSLPWFVCTGISFDDSTVYTAWHCLADRDLEG